MSLPVLLDSILDQIEPRPSAAIASLMNEKVRELQRTGIIGQGATPAQCFVIARSASNIFSSFTLNLNPVSGRVSASVRRSEFKIKNPRQKAGSRPNKTEGRRQTATSFSFNRMGANSASRPSRKGNSK